MEYGNALLHGITRARAEGIWEAVFKVGADTELWRKLYQYVVVVGSMRGAYKILPKSEAWRLSERSLAYEVHITKRSFQPTLSPDDHRLP